MVQDLGSLEGPDLRPQSSKPTPRQFLGPGCALEESHPPGSRATVGKILASKYIDTVDSKVLCDAKYSKPCN